MRKRLTKTGRTYDAIIIGMGPAGSSAALMLANAGKSVLAIDSQKFPRYKSCGGFVSAKTSGLLPFDFSSAAERTIQSASLTYKSGKPLVFRSDGPLGYNVMREKFDRLLLEKARSAGAETIENCRITGISEGASYVTAKSPDGQAFKAHFLIDAHGAGPLTGSPIFGVESKDHDITLTAEVDADPDEINHVFGSGIVIDLGCVPYGYAWIFPKKKRLSIGICAYAGDTSGADLKRCFKRFIDTHTCLKGRAIGKITGWRLPIHGKKSPPPVKGRILLAGDAGRIVEPMLGEGIYYAILSARAAAHAVNDCIDSGTDDLSQYPDYLQKSLYKDFEYAAKLARLVFSYPKLWFSLAGKYPSVVHRYLNVIKGAERYEAFYNWISLKIKHKPVDLIKKIAWPLGFNK